MKHKLVILLSALVLAFIISTISVSVILSDQIEKLNSRCIDEIVEIDPIEPVNFYYLFNL